MLRFVIAHLDAAAAVTVTETDADPTVTRRDRRTESASPVQLVELIPGQSWSA
jgi:hypothetical protein